MTTSLDKVDEVGKTVVDKGAESASDRSHRLRWWILALLGLGQIMIVLDATIVTIALPDAAKDLNITSGQQWVVTAYALAFGSLLLLGGRLADLFGRRNTLMVGLVGFAVMSAVGGFATNFEMLIVARAGQGIFAALLAPAVLSLLTTTFSDPKERATAFGVFGAIAGSGAAIGLLLGGALTEVSWRLTMLVNLPIAVVVLVGALFLLNGSRADEKPKLDIIGSITAAAGLFSVVYGFSTAESHGWGNVQTIAWLVAGVVLLAAFVLFELRAEHPLLPMRVLADRTRAGSYLVMFISGIGMFAVFVYLTYYMQVQLGFAPVKSGAAFLPMVAGMIFSSTVASTVLVPRLGARIVTPIGMVLAGVGLLLLAQLEVDSSYAAHILPALIVMGLGVGAVFAPAMQGAVTGVDGHDAGVASALVNTMQQVGASIGTALLATFVASAADDYVSSHRNVPNLVNLAATHSYTVAFYWAMGIFFFGAVVAAAVLRSGKPAAPAEGVVHMG